MANSNKKKKMRKKILPGPHCSRRKETTADLALTSSSDDLQDFPGFLSTGECFKNKITCYECSSDFVTSEKISYDDLKHAMKMGMRWHCPSCLRNPCDITRRQVPSFPDADQ